LNIPIFFHNTTFIYR